jgi:hypothetical protein
MNQFLEFLALDHQTGMRRHAHTHRMVSGPIRPLRGLRRPDRPAEALGRPVPPPGREPAGRP